MANGLRAFCIAPLIAGIRSSGSLSCIFRSYNVHVSHWVANTPASSRQRDPWVYTYPLAPLSNVLNTPKWTVSRTVRLSVVPHAFHVMQTNSKVDGKRYVVQGRRKDKQMV